MKMIRLVPLILILGCASLDPNSDALMVRTQQFEKSALATMKSIGHYERLYHPTLPEPTRSQLHVAVEQMRRDGLRYLDDLDVARLTYKTNRLTTNVLATAESKANINALTAAIQTMLDKAAIEYAKAKQIKP